MTFCKIIMQITCRFFYKSITFAPVVRNYNDYLIIKPK